MKKLLSILALLFVCLSASAATTNSVSRFGVTWTFDQSYTVGTYCTGDPWVIGPVTINSVSPAWDGTKNGMMVNPSPMLDYENPTGPLNGWDTRMQSWDGWMHYDDSKNDALSLPLVVAVNSSVVSAVGLPGTPAYAKVQNYAILTVVASQPAEDSFRPSHYFAETKTSPFRESHINWAALNTLPRASVAGTLPSITDLADRMLKPSMYLCTTAGDTIVHPANMVYTPGGNGMGIAFVTGDAGMVLNLDYSQAEKRDLLLGVLQTAIDELKMLEHGAQWYMDGGHNSGRLTPIVVAAGVLGGAFRTYAGMTASRFQEGQETIFLTSEYFTTPMGWMMCCRGAVQSPQCSTNGGPNEYVRRHGNCEPVYEFWENAPAPDTTYNVVGSAWLKLGNEIWRANNTWSGFDNGYIDMASSSITGPTMTARVMGLREAVNHEPLFVYAARIADTGWEATKTGWWNPSSAFHKSFYTAFKYSPPPPNIDTNPPTIDDVVNAVSSTNALITWTTSENARSGVDYGTTTNYSATQTNATFLLSHSATLTGLTPNTVYFYRLHATDNSTNSRLTGAYTFTTDYSNRVSLPVINPSSASGITPVTVTIASATPGASIRFTVDGTIPGGSSILYTGAFLMTSNCILQAIGTKTGFTNSYVATASYNIFTVPERDPSVPTTGLGVWFTGQSAMTNTSGVVLWYDISDNERNASPNVAPLRIDNVINGQPAVRFDGANDYMTFTMPVNGLTGVTMFIVGANRSDQDTLPANVGDAALFWNEIGSWGTLYFSPLQRYLGIRFGTGQVGNDTLHTRPVSVEHSYTISAARKNGTTDQVFTNGVLAQQWTGRLPAVAYCQDTASLGMGYQSSPFNGDIAELLVYERSLSDEEMTTVNTYLSSKYGFSTNPPSIPPAAPTFTPNGSAFAADDGMTNITVSCNETNTLRMWINSGVLMVSNTPAVVTVTNGQTLTAYATNLDAVRGSQLTTRTYTLTNGPLGQVALVTAYPPGGTNLDSVTVALTCSTLGAQILWTTNDWGVSNLYSGSITLQTTAYLKARGTNTGWTDSLDSPWYFVITNAPATNQVEIPVITASTASIAAVSMVMSCATDGASIRFTRDGSVPTVESDLYSAPFDVTSNVTIRASGFKADFTNSAPVTAVFEINDFNLTRWSWRNFALPEQATNFSVTFDATTADNNSDMLVGLAPAPAASYFDMACIARFNTAGFIDCRNGGSYTATNSLPYSSNGLYSFRLDVNVTNKTYTCFAGTNGGAMILVWSNALWRTEQQTASSLTALAMVNTTTNGSVQNFALSGTEPPPESFPPLPPALAPPGELFASVETNISISVDATNTIELVFNGEAWSSNSSAVLTVSNGVTLVCWATNAATATGSELVTRSYVLTVPFGPVEPPEIYPASGSYLDSVLVSIGCPTPGAVVLWSTNYGNDWSVFSEPFTLTNTSTVMSVATNQNWNNSEYSFATYTVTNALLLADSPTITPFGGSFYDYVDVILTAPGMPSPTFLWTTNAWSSTNSTSAFTLNNSAFLIAVTHAEGWAESAPLATIFTVTNAPPLAQPGSAITIIGNSIWQINVILR